MASKNYDPRYSQIHPMKGRRFIYAKDAKVETFIQGQTVGMVGSDYVLVRYSIKDGKPVRFTDEHLVAVKDMVDWTFWEPSEPTPTAELKKSIEKTDGDRS
jgi:hypothetical protein